MLLTKVFMLGSLCCGIAHIGYITGRYFSFQTITRITMDKRQRIETPTLVACVPYLQVLDYAALNHKLGINESDHKDKEWYASMMTVRDIFEFTPKRKQVLKKCLYRKHQDRRALVDTPRDCAYFQIRKFVMQSFICYSVFPEGENRTSFLIEDLASSYNFEHTVYILEWDQVFNTVRNMFVIQTDTPYPYRSRAYGSMKLLDTTLGDRDKTMEIFVRNKITQIRLQPAPYETMCNPRYTLADKTNCLIREMEEKGLDRVPNTVILTKPMDRKQIQPIDEKNETTRNLMDKIYTNCGQEEQEKCVYTISETDARFYESNATTNVRFRVMSPLAANALIVTMPAFKSYEYLLYICSCAGIWFGLSVQDFCPDRLLPKLTRVRQHLSEYRKQRTIQRMEPGPWKLITPHSQTLARRAPGSGARIQVKSAAPEQSTFTHKLPLRPKTRLRY